ncbi:A/G-specific adenine glycosylase, partial [Candidatus Uhrbacteria bacterium]|nr:A/G-specific adenine glycosylase [Candidatus Uhrbacteria bacterium]MBD3284431.1 A/G-specific adenine glycosylase [Candidatus Uhrbacteria bacterium]
MSDVRITKLLNWYRKHGRDLPWRKTKDPYRIFVSEMMLQQTQVAHVIPFYRNWLRTFPSWKALSKAKTDQLIRAWVGLGYNRRALYMREAAKTVVQTGVPSTIEDWQSLKGIGPYAAAAIYAFTAHRPAPAIETNIRRVIGRAFLKLPFPEIANDGRIRAVLQKVLTHHTHWIALHALMDLGAMICSVKNPSCAICPLKHTCPSRKLFELGIKQPKRKKVKEYIHHAKPFPDRIYRGKILKLIREEGSMNLEEIGKRIDPRFDANNDARWVQAMVKRLTA